MVIKWFLIEFLGLWESINNPNFKGVEFEGFLNEAGSYAFALSPKRWVESTNAIGVVYKSGKLIAKSRKCASKVTLKALRLPQ